MKTFIVLLFTLFSIQATIGQNNEPLESTRYGGFGLRLGFNRIHVLDRNNSALLYQGNVPTLSLNYQHVNSGNRWLGELTLGRGSYFSRDFPDRVIQFRNKDVYGHVDSVSVPMRANNTLMKLSLGYLRDIDPAGPLRYQIGGQVSDALFYPQGFVQAGLMNVASVSPMAGMAFQPNDRQYLSLRITVPVFSLVSRSTYNNSVSQPIDNKLVGFFDQGSYWASFSKHREIKIGAAFHFRMGNRWMSGLHYDFRILKNTYPKDLTITQSEVGLSMQMVR
ncbi:MAG: hypothetical protein R2824_35475 [Saprospiraceae bacterium]|nr:hypothetical protein [Lewinella sp.]